MSDCAMAPGGPLTRRQWLTSAAVRLAGTEAPLRTAEILLCHVLNVDRVHLVTDPDAALPPKVLPALDALVERRRGEEPVAYLTGQKEFYGRPFQVTPATLIPRPETELLVDETLKRLPESPIRFADLGTGSGCLAVTLAAERPAWSGTALDISAGALECARANASAHGVDNRLTFSLADFTLCSFPDDVEKFDLVVSNPPYITEPEYAELDATVRAFEPKSALVPDAQGTSHLKAVIELAAHALAPGGLLLMEHGAAQGPASRAMCPPAVWKLVETFPDLAGLDRCLLAIRL